MKRSFFVLILLFALMLNAVEKFEVTGDEPFPLTHWLSEEEAARWNEIVRDFYVTDPPAAPVHNVAEFEKMEGVLVRYPFGIPVSLIADMSQHTKVVTIISSTSQQNTVLSQYNSNGVDTDNCEFLIAPSDSYWTRDFGPWYVIDGNGEFGITNFPYNRPRPNDDDIPIEVADFLDINLFGMDVEHTGGNYMTDGLGISASSDLVYEENSISNDEVNQRMLDYLGIQTYHVVNDPNNTYIDHIDCWGKFLDVDKVLIREVPTSHAQYDEIEEVAAYFAEQTSSYGNNYQVYRVNTPGDQPYSNSLILNDHVYVPQTGNATYDAAALEVYQEAMPGYTIVGVPNGPEPWESTDALHCRTKGIADREMLYIYHLPLLDDQPADIDQTITCDITAYSGGDVIEDEVFLHYQVGNDDWQDVIMTSADDITWTAEIPGQPAGSVVSYYISALDSEGISANHPFIGSADPHVYCAGGQQEPQLDIDPDDFQITIAMDTVITQTLQISNTGGGVINYSLEFSDVSRDVTGCYVECAQQYFTPGEVIDFDFTIYNQSPDNEWLREVSISFPDGFSVISATDFMGGSGGAMEFLGDTGNNALCLWYGETSSGFGVVQDGQSASCTVQVEVAADFAGNTTLDWEIAGDEYGNDPHQTSGSIALEIYGGPVSWISADQLGGELWAMESDEINISFDSHELPQDSYSCFIVIEWNDNETMIPVDMTVQSVPETEDEIITPISSIIAYPNPFSADNMRNSISIEYTITQQSAISADIYNIKGQKVAALFEGNAASGTHQLSWNGTGDNGKKLSTGLYFLRIAGDDFVSNKKLMLIK